MTKKAAPAKKGKAKAEKAPKAVKVEASSEHKASEVIAPVPVALLEANPSLPLAERWLSLFAEHYIMTEARHRALEAQVAKPAPAVEAEPARDQAKPAGKKQRSAFLPPTLPGAARPVAAPLPDLAWHTPTAPTPEPELALSTEPEAEAEAFAAVAAVDQGETTAEFEPPEASPAPEPEPESEFDLFAQLAAEEQRIEDPDDFLARLTAQGEAAVDGRSFDFEESGFTGAADPSSPFIAPLDDSTTMIAAIADEDEGTTMIAAIADEDEGTRMIAAMPDAADDEAPLAEPSDSTTMIAAITDEDLENLANPSEDGAAAKAARKSRKSSKKKKG